MEKETYELKEKMNEFTGKLRVDTIPSIFPYNPSETRGGEIWIKL